MKKIIYKPIGIIHTRFKATQGVPNQPTAGKNVAGFVEILREYIEGLNDLEGFFHLILIYHFHLSVGYTLRVKPFMHDRLRGVFATRSPRRQNPTGTSVVRLTKVKKGRIYVELPARRAGLPEEEGLFIVCPLTPPTRRGLRGTFRPKGWIW